MKNIKKIVALAFAGLTVTGIGLVTPAHASTTSIPKNYSYDYSKFDSAPIPYYYMGKNKNAYMWNYSHTKKIHNLKNYPNTVWLVTNATVRTTKGKRAVYYKMYSAYNHTVKGLVWAGYLAKNIAKSPSLFKTDADYTKYINTDRSQVIAKGIAKLFPNSKISLELSQGKSNGFDNPTVLVNSSTIDFNKFINSSPKGSIEEVKQALEKQGYTAAKRASMKDYSIGIKVVVNAQGAYSNALYKGLTSSIYPGNHGRYYDENIDWDVMLNTAKNK